MSGLITRDDIDCQAWEWIDADGVAHALAEVNAIVTGQAAGFGIPPTRRHDVRIPGRPGAYNLGLSYAERQLSLQVAIVGNGPQAVEEAIAAWASRLNVLRGEGQIRRTRADGVTQRVLDCAYDAGFGLDQQQGIWRKGVQTAVLVFFAADPFWYDAADTEVLFGSESVVEFFPIPNPITGSFVTLATSEILGGATITNDGDVPAYPVWEIAGPASSIVLRNTTTGKLMEFSENGGLVIVVGETLNIDTRPGQTSLTVDGVNVASYLSDESELWPLALGSNAVQVEAGGTTVNSQATLSYRRGFLTS